MCHSAICVCSCGRVNPSVGRVDRAEDGLDVGHGQRCYAVATRLRDRRALRPGGEEQVEDGEGTTLEVGRTRRLTGLDPLEQQPVEQAEEPAGDRVDVEPGGELAAGDALRDEIATGADQPLPARGEHLAHARLAVGLRPGLDERDLAGIAVVVVDRLDVQADGDGHPLRGGRRRRQALGQFVQPARGDLVAGQPDQLVLAREVGIDRADRQAALADDVGDGRAVIALVAEDTGRGGQDPVPDLLLVGGADSRHIDS